METFVGLILFVVFTVSNGVVILIAVEKSGKDTWYGLANVKTLDKDKLAVDEKTMKTEVDKISSDNTPDPFIWTRAVKCKCQFIPDESTMMKKVALKGIAVNNHWIETTMTSPKFTLQLPPQISLSAIGIERTFSGYETTGNGALLVMSPVLYNDSKTLFENSNKTKFNMVKDGFALKSNTPVFVEFDLQIEGDKSKALLLINFNGVSEVGKKVQGAVTTTGCPYLTSACYIMFEASKSAQYALGKIEFENTNGELRIGQIWNHKDKSYAKVTKVHNSLLKDVRTFTIIAQDIVKTKDPSDFPEVFRFTMVVSPLSNTYELPSGEFGFKFNLGKPGIVEYVYNGTQTLPVYYDQTSNVLTFIGKEDINTFDTFRLFTKTATDKLRSGKIGSDTTDHVVLMKLFDLPIQDTDVSESPPPSRKLIGAVSIPDGVGPQDALDNVFKYQLFQSKYKL